MGKILGFTMAVVLAASAVYAQKIPVEFSVGVGGYFPHDGRYSQFFDHNPANFSLQAAYGWSVLDFKAGFENLKKRSNNSSASSGQRTFSQNGVFIDSIALINSFSTINSYVRASTFRLGAAFHPFRSAAFSPFLGLGGSVVFSKGYGNRELRTDSTFFFADTSRPNRSLFDTKTAAVAQFSESVVGAHIEAGAQARLPHNFFFVFEAIRDLRSLDRAGILGPGRGGGTLIGMRLGYRFY